MLMMRVVVGPDCGPVTLFFPTSPHMNSGVWGSGSSACVWRRKVLHPIQNNPRSTQCTHRVAPLHQPFASLHWTGRNRRDLARSKLLGMRYDVSP